MNQSDSESGVSSESLQKVLQATIYSNKRVVKWLSLLSGPLLGSLNFNQEVLGSPPGSARRRRYIEEAELFNIEVSEQPSLSCLVKQCANLSLPPPGVAGCGLFRLSLPRPRTYSEISPDLHEHSKSKQQWDGY